MLKPFLCSLEMLHCKNGSRHKDCTLLAVGNTLKHRPECYLGFTKTNITAKQSVHRGTFFHITLDFLTASQLVIRFVIFKPQLKVTLHITILAESEALGAHSLCIKRNKLLSHILDRSTNPCLGLFPVR